MKVIDFSKENSILNQFVSEVRNVEVQHDSLRFRRNLERIGEVMAYEMSKVLKYSVRDIQTPLGIAKVSLPDNQIVLSTILRAGLPYHQGFLNYFDKAENAFVSAYRKYTADDHFDIHIEYIASPPIGGKTNSTHIAKVAIGCSVALKSRVRPTAGETAEISYAAMLDGGAAIAQNNKTFPADKTTIWCGAIDPEINAHSYIIPGLGDAGDLAYGDKE